MDRRDVGREADPRAGRSGQRGGSRSGPRPRADHPSGPGVAGATALAPTPGDPVRGGARRGPGDGRKDTERAPGGISPEGLRRHPRHRRPRHPRGAGCLGDILSGGGWDALAPRCRQMKPRPPEALHLALEAIQDLKANQLVVLDLRGLTDATDYFVIASGTSDAHVRGIAESVIEKLNRRGHRTHHVEGLNGGRWVLLDFVDFVVHLFHPETRSFYQLERLWGDAPELLISSS